MQLTQLVAGVCHRPGSGTMISLRSIGNAIVFVTLGLAACAVVMSATFHSESTSDRVAQSRSLSAHGQDEMFTYHKTLFPPDGADVLCFTVAAAGLIVAASGGIGGGGILVPLYMIFLRFRPKHAVALSNFTILGGAFANTALNAPKLDENGRALINWDIIVMMEPATLAGTVLGSFASKYLADFVLMGFLAAVLAILSFRTLDKGLEMFHHENTRDAELQAVPQHEDADMADDFQHEASDVDDEPKESRNLVGDARLRTVGEGTPWLKVSLLVLCFMGCVVLTVLKGGGQGSVVGVTCGSSSFWLLSWAQLPWVLGFGLIFRDMLINENLDKEEDGHDFDASEIRWTSATTIRYPLLCSLAGILAGLFGVGGGIIKGPLMLELGVAPQVASATAAAMILFTSMATAVSFQVFGLLEPSYGSMCFMLGFCCTLLGHYIVHSFLQGAKRQSPPVLSIGCVMAVSTALLIVETIGRLYNMDFGKLIEPTSLCSIDE
ncbi:unnamed protein product [Symbiodinium pilosum]|uniref:Uncharacterized protein n=1 Tax=Symbiodinium pilosum TaxID=2952 RepID=A0A812U791_SYMPI|nr:unnamed protein product [Symbiodinium pilosum]